MTKNEDKRHLTLKSVLYPSLKRKMDKAKFGLLGLIIIMAVVIAGCPMEINANIGTDISNIKKAPGDTVTETVTVTEPGETEYVVVKVDVNRLRVINLQSTASISEVKIDDKSLDVGAGGIPSKTSKMWIVESKNPHPATSSYTVKSPSFKSPYVNGVPVTMPPDAVIVVEDNQTVILPPEGDVTFDKTNEALIIIYNMSYSNDVTTVQFNADPAISTPVLTKRTTAAPTPTKFEKKVPAPPTAYTIVATRTGGGTPLTKLVNVAAGDTLSVFIGDDDIIDMDSTPPGKVVDLQLTADHEAKKITASWLPPAIIPSDFAGYTVYLDNGTTVDINITAPTPGVRQTWDSATIYPPATAPLPPLPNGPYAVAVSSRDITRNLSEPEVKSVAILDLIAGPLVIPKTVLSQPVMYAPARLAYETGDWSATIEWTATEIPSPDKPLETITGISRFRGGVTYAPTITVSAKNGKAFKDNIEITINEWTGSDPLPSTLVTASSNKTIAIAGPCTGYARTEVGGQHWYVGGGFSNYDTINNSKTGASPADAVIGLEVALERIKSERKWATGTAAPGYQYAAVHINYPNSLAISFPDTLTLDNEYPPRLYIQGDDGTTMVNSRINASKGAFAEIVDSTRTLVIGGTLVIEGSGDYAGAIQVIDGTLVLTSRLMKFDGNMSPNTPIDRNAPKINSNPGVGIRVEEHGAVHMFSGAITKNGNPSNALGTIHESVGQNVNVNGGTFTMYDGVITNAPGYNVSVFGGQFTTDSWSNSPLADKDKFQVPPQEGTYPYIATGADGAIYLYGGGNATLKTGLITRNGGSSNSLAAIDVGPQSKLELGKVVIENNTGYGIYIGVRREEYSNMGGGIPKIVILNDETVSNSAWPKIQNNTKTGIYMKAERGTLVHMKTGTISGNNTDYSKTGALAGGIYVRDSGKYVLYYESGTGSAILHAPWTNNWNGSADSDAFHDIPDFSGDYYYSRLDIRGGTISGNYGSAGYSGGVHYQQGFWDSAGGKGFLGFTGIDIDFIRFSFKKTGGVIQNNTTVGSPSSTTVGSQVHISHNYGSGNRSIDDETQSYQHDLRIVSNITAADSLDYGAFDNNGLTISPPPAGTWTVTSKTAAKHNSQLNDYAIWR